MGEWQKSLVTVKSGIKSLQIFTRFCAMKTKWKCKNKRRLVKTKKTRKLRKQQQKDQTTYTTWRQVKSSDENFSPDNGTKYEMACKLGYEGIGLLYCIWICRKPLVMKMHTSEQAQWVESGSNMWWVYQIL